MNKTLLQQAVEKMSKIIIHLSLLLSLIMGREATTFCQNDFKTPVIPPSPTSSVFLRYGNDQPSLQTGTVNIPISLFNIQAKGLNIPLSLTYQTSGINVADVPYPAGYGWVFSPGFRITRIVLGRPDGSFQYRESNASEEYEIIKRGIIDEGIANLHQLNQSDLFDTQKDIFTLHMPSGSFNFFIKKTGSAYEAISIGHQIKIEVDPGLTEFKVTDSDGIIYKFGYDNTSSFLDYTEPTALGYGASAWMLREIILLNNEKINFSWQKVNTNAYSPKVNTPISIKDRSDYNCVVPPYEVDDPGGIIDYSSYSGANALMLKKIEYPGGVVDLTYRSSQDPFLQTIIAKNKNNDIVKTINLTYGTSTANAANLLLNSLNINGETYNFQYNSNNFGLLTTGLDYWGYYNGKTNNSSLIPKMRLKIFLGWPNWTGDYSTIYEEFGSADRSVSAEHMKAFMLQKIIFPTGGYSEYEYEPHQFPGQSVHTNGELFFQNPDPISSGGGLRVSKIETYTSVGSIPLIKTYKYGENENGMANPPVVPTLETFIEELRYIKEEIPGVSGTCQGAGGVHWRTFRQMNINALSNYSKFLVSKNPIWYNYVTEYINNEQKTKYSFSFHDTYAISWQLNSFAVKSPYAFRYDNLFNKGPELINSTIFKKVGIDYIPVQQAVNEYEVVQNSAQNVYNVIIDRRGIVSHLNLPGPDFYPPEFYDGGLYPTGIAVPGDGDFQKLIYSIAVQYDRLKKSSTTLYDNGQAINTYENFLYNDYEQLIKIVKETSINGMETSVEYKHPNDFNDPIYQQMTAKNIVSPVIEETTSKGSNVIKRIKTNYTNDLNISNGLFLPSSIEASYTPTGSFTKEVVIEKYDGKGNLLQKSHLESPKISYIWGYGNQYPIAEIINADYTTVVAALGGQSIVDAYAASMPVDDNSVRSFTASLRVSLPNAQITSYTYKPLIGMTSKTDPNGRTIYYSYDDIGRLVLIRDQDNNILKKVCYNYSGQPESCLVCTTTAANWQSTGNYRCVLDGNGNNTGYQEREERDYETCSATYNQLRWEQNGYNTLACSRCAGCGTQGIMYRCVNGECETGIRVYTDSWEEGGTWFCIYHYEFSDGYWTSDVWETSGGTCL